MNSFSLPKFYIPVIILGMTAFGCSSLIERQSLFDQSAPKKEAAPSVVPKAQYDQLLAKYEELLQKSSAPANVSSAPTQMESQTSADIVENLAQSTEVIDAGGAPELVETVDVFGDGQAPQVATTSRKQETKLDIPQTPEDLENQLLSLRKAKRLVQDKQFNPAMSQLKSLEDSSFLQIKVRARFLIGEILYQQQSYDLAMQVYEDIVHNYAFSGVVLEALQKLVVCSEKLNLPKKKELYFSMLHDFF